MVESDAPLSLRQEVPGILAGRGETGLDILNFTNLLNKKWGNVYDIDFPYARTLANFSGIDPVTGKYSLLVADEFRRKLRTGCVEVGRPIRAIALVDTGDGSLHTF